MKIENNLCQEEESQRQRYGFKLEKVIQDKMMMMMMMFLKLETDKKTKKNMSTVNMHMQTKFFLWEGLVELLL